jgi:hypothetical protein
MDQQLTCAGAAALGGLYFRYINILPRLVFGDTAVPVLPTYIEFSFHLIPSQLVSTVDPRTPHHVSFQTRGRY